MELPTHQIKETDTLVAFERVTKFETFCLTWKDNIRTEEKDGFFSNRTIGEITCPECGSETDTFNGHSSDGWTAGQYGAIDVDPAIHCTKCKWGISF